MLFIFTIVGILFGLSIGVGIAAVITISAMKKSNDIGDSQGTLRDFDATIDILNSEDGLRKYIP